MTEEFKVGDRVRHIREDFIGTVVRLLSKQSIMVSCDPPYRSPYEEGHRLSRGIENGYSAQAYLLVRHSEPNMKDGLEEYEAIMAAQELGL
jgi:hypothetical protein